MKWSTAFVFIAILLVGCRSAEQYSPEQVMEKAIESEAEEIPYYGEMTMKIEDDEDIFELKSKEWRKGNKSLEEVVAEGEKVITLKEDTTITMYDETENTVMETEFEEDSELNLSSKEQLENMLENVEETHTFEKRDDEKIAGRDTMHIVAEKKQGEKSIFGTQEIWIDKENWRVLKTIDETEDSYSVMEYTKFEIEPDMSDDVFTLDLPDDVEIDSFDDDLEEEITLEEAQEKLGDDILYIKEDDEFILDEVTYQDLFDEDDEAFLIELSYEKDHLPYMDISITETDDEEEELDDVSEPVDIRGVEGSYTDLDDAHIISWTEDGYDYSIFFINPNLSLDEMTEQIEKMEEVPSEKE